MNPMVSSQDFFMNSIQLTEDEIYSIQCVIEEYAEGGDLLKLLNAADIKYSKFSKAVGMIPSLKALFDDVKPVHKQALIYSMLSIVKEQAKESKDWKAAKWLLEVLDPHTFGKKLNLTDDREKMNPEVVDAIIAEYSRV